MTGTWDDAGGRRALRAIFDASIAAADPAIVLAPHLPEKPQGRCIVVVGAG
jgi:glycerate 2-kinase